MKKVIVLGVAWVFLSLAFVVSTEAQRGFTAECLDPDGRRYQCYVVTSPRIRPTDRRYDNDRYDRRDRYEPGYRSLRSYPRDRYQRNDRYDDYDRDEYGDDRPVEHQQGSRVVRHRVYTNSGNGRSWPSARYQVDVVTTKVWVRSNVRSRPPYIRVSSSGLGGW